MPHKQQQNNQNDDCVLFYYAPKEKEKNPIQSPDWAKPVRLPECGDHNLLNLLSPPPALRMTGDDQSEAIVAAGSYYSRGTWRQRGQRPLAAGISAIRRHHQEPRFRVKTLTSGSCQ